MSLLQSMPIGQYLPGSSYLHRRDPRSKFIATLLFLFVVFLAKSLLSFVLVTGITLVGVWVSRVPFLYILRGLKPVWFLLFITALIQLFTLQEGTLLFSIGPLSVYEGGVRETIFVTARIILLMVSASLLTLTTSPIQLTDGLESLFSPLKRFRFPAHELAMMISISLRFIPTLMDETDRIAKAQMSRGASFSSGPLLKRVHHVLSLIVPLFVQSFKRAEDLAMAMEARGYRGGAGRTRYRRLQWTIGDTWLLSMVVLAGALVVAFRG